MAILGAIDLGTNTFRLLIAEIKTASTFKTLYSENRITRLGEGFVDEKRIRPAALQRGLTALRAFRNTLDTMQIKAVSVVGTSALREASNRNVFLEEVKRHCGFDVLILSGEDEARASLLGVSLLFKDQKPAMLVCDIGGGSTEFIGRDGIHPDFIYSTHLGAIALYEHYLRSDPPKPDEMRALKSAIFTELEKLSPPFPWPKRLVGTAGTVTTLAAIDLEMRQYKPEQINGHVLTASRITQIVDKLSGIPAKARAKIAGLEKGREDIILSGSLILKGIMDRFGYDRLRVSDYGLREGILIDLFQKQAD